jgi:capsular polysaccharide biosynthesis protein
MEDPWNLDFRVANGFDGQAASYLEARQVSESELDVCVLANWTSRNFHHWVLEEMPKVMVAEAAGFSGRYVVDREPGFLRQMLHLVGIDEARIVGQPSGPTRYRSAIFLPTLSGRISSVGDVYLSLRRWLQEACGATASVPRRRIWMERGPTCANGRTGIVKPSEIYEVLSKHGIERVDLATLPVHEQIVLTSSAELLTGPSGTAFAHVLFQPHQSDVVECFSPRFINASVLDLCVLMRHDYRMVVHNNAYGAYPYGDDLRVDRTQFELALNALG